MAKVNSPLLSLGASGSIGKTITFGRWKGIATARQTVTPANPRTAAQIAQRDIMTAIVSFWRTFLLGLQGKEAWNRDATASGKAQSGFNAFASQATRALAQDETVSMVVGAGELGLGGTFSVDLEDLIDGSVGTEAGNFTCNYGPSITQMLNSVTGAIAAGSIDFETGAALEGETRYFQVVKTAGEMTAAKRSGIFKLVAAE